MFQTHGFFKGPWRGTAQEKVARKMKMLNNKVETRS